MDCKKSREQMIEATMSEPSAELRAHTGQCTSCAQEWRELQATMALLDEWQAPEASPFFATRLKARLKDADARRSHGILAWLRQPALGMPLWRPMAAGVLAVAAVVGVSIYNVDGPKPQQTAQHIVQKSLAVKDLEALEKNQDLYANIDLLDDLDSTADHSTDKL